MLDHPDDIARAGLCSGCGACVFAAPDKIIMKIDSTGFFRPVVSSDLAAAERDVVRCVCPGIGLEHAPSADYLAAWGPVKSCWVGHAAMDEVRYVGSSGGVVTGTALYLLETGQIDFVVHVRGSAAQPLENEIVFSRTRESLLGGAGSRYSPAAPVAAIPRALAEPGRFAFIGKPCDVAAVRKILAARPELNERIPYLLSFMCAGTPSAHGTTEIIRKFGFDSAKVVEFRYRGRGWPGTTAARTQDGAEAQMDYNTAWGKILNRHLQPRCKICADGTGEFADLVGADAWYGKDGYPDFAEREGRSLILSRTQKGEDLLARAAAEGRVMVEPFEPSGISPIQPYQVKRKRSLLARLLALKAMRRQVPQYKGMHLWHLAASAGLIENLKVFLGSVKRIAGNRL
jgi:coenzyme F420 hydrogenase subunit beta